MQENNKHISSAATFPLSSSNLIETYYGNILELPQIQDKLQNLRNL